MNELKMYSPNVIQDNITRLRDPFPSCVNGAQTEDIIVSLEAILIEGLEPRQNRRRGDNFRAFEYLQMKDPELEKQEKKRLAAEIIGSI